MLQKLLTSDHLSGKRKEHQKIKVREHVDEYREADNLNKMLMIMGNLDEGSDGEKRERFHKMTRNYIMICWKKRCEKLGRDPMEEAEEKNSYASARNENRNRSERD